MNIKSFAAALILSGMAQLAAANPLSVHVLNLQDGLPSAQVDVTLEKQAGKQWVALGAGTTNADGRIPALFPEGERFEKGVYRVTFKTGAWFAARKTDSFFPEVPVVFVVDGKVAHYHIPLLISPFGFSTYRGN